MTATQPPEPTKSAAELIREIAARDPEAHAAALARGYGVGPVDRLPDRPSDGQPVDDTVTMSVIKTLGSMLGERDAELDRRASALAAVEAERDEARAEIERYRRPCEACGFQPSTHDHARDCPRLPALATGASELARLRAKVEAVERLHCECTTGNCACGGGPGWCHGCGESWPCSTRAAVVDGETQP